MNTQDLLLIFVAISIPYSDSKSLCPDLDPLRLLNGFKLQIDAYLDIVLENLRHIMVENGYSRIPLPNASSSFSENFLGVRWYGEAAAFSGLLEGMESINRSGPAFVNLANEDIIFSTDLDFKSVFVSYDLKAKFMGLGPTANASGKLKKLRCFLRGKANKVDPTKITLEELKLHDIGKLSLKISGLGTLLDVVSSEIGQKIGNEVKGVVAEEVENVIKSQLNDIIASTQLPLPWPC